MPQPLERLEKVYFITCNGRPFGYGYDDHRKAWSTLIKLSHDKGLVKCKIGGRSYFVDGTQEPATIYEIHWIGVKR